MAKTSSLREGFFVKSLSQQAEILVPGDASSFKIVPDDGNWNLVVGGNYNRSNNARFVIRAMTALLPNKLKTCGEKHFF